MVTYHGDPPTRFWWGLSLGLFLLAWALPVLVGFGNTEQTWWQALLLSPFQVYFGAIALRGAVRITVKLHRTWRARRREAGGT